MPAGWTAVQEAPPPPIQSAPGWTRVEEDKSFHPLDSAKRAISEWLDSGPVGALKGTAAAIRDPKAAASGALDQNGELWKRATDAYDKGDYVGSAAHALNYALNGIPGLGYSLDSAGGKFKSGDVSGGVGQTLGVATNLLLGAKGPQILDAATDVHLPSGPQAVTALKAVKDVYHVFHSANPITKVKAGASLVKAIRDAVSEAPAAPPPDPGAEILAAMRRDNASARLANDVAETKAALEAPDPTPGTPAIATPLQAPASAPQFVSQAPAPPPAQASTVPDYKYPLPSPEEVAARIKPSAPVAPAPTPIAVPPAVEAIPENATPAQLSKFPAKQVVDWLKGRNMPASQPIPVARPAAPAQAAPASAPVSIAQQLADEMLKNGTATPEMVAGSPAGAETSIGDTAIRDIMREVHPGMGKELARANYAGNQEPGVAGQMYEAAGRAQKAQTLAAALRSGGISYKEALTMDKSHWEMISKALGVNAPSKQSIGEALFRLQRLEAPAARGIQ